MQTFRTCQRVALQQLFLLMRSRIDNQLRIDIPKWKQWLSPQSWEEWEEFLLSGLDKLGGTSQETSQWPLELLASTIQADSLPPHKREAMVRIITMQYTVHSGYFRMHGRIIISYEHHTKIHYSTARF